MTTLIHYRYAKPKNFSYLIPDSQLNMYVKVQTAPGESSNVFIETPEVTVENGIQKSEKNKYSVAFREGGSKEFNIFMGELNSNIERYGKEAWPGEIFRGNGFDYIAKVPFRYNRFETIVKDADGHITNIYNLIKTGFKAKLKLELKNVWRYNESFGPLWEVREINLTHQTFSYIN